MSDDIRFNTDTNHIDTSFSTTNRSVRVRATSSNQSQQTQLMNDDVVLHIKERPVPTPKDGKLTILREGVAIGTFSADQATDTEINITGVGGPKWYVKNATVEQGTGDLILIDKDNQEIVRFSNKIDEMALTMDNNGEHLSLFILQDNNEPKSIELTSMGLTSSDEGFGNRLIGESLSYNEVTPKNMSIIQTEEMELYVNNNGTPSVAKLNDLGFSRIINCTEGNEETVLNKIDVGDVIIVSKKIKSMPDGYKIGVIKQKTENGSIELHYSADKVNTSAWAAQGTVTSDTTVNSAKTYYSKSTSSAEVGYLVGYVTGDDTKYAFSAVTPSGSENPHNLGWVELSKLGKGASDVQAVLESYDDAVGGGASGVSSLNGATGDLSITGSGAISVGTVSDRHIPLSVRDGTTSQTGVVQLVDTYTTTGGSANYNNNTLAATNKAITAAIGTLDVSNITSNLGQGKTITALSETDGKISATASNILITENQVTDLVTHLGQKALASDLTSHTSNTNNPHSVTKSQVGLGNVTNDSQVKRSEMGTANGVATLGSDTKIPLSQLPDAILGQLVYGGTVTGAGVATLSDNAKTKLGTTDNSITLVNSAGTASSKTGWVANQGIFYIVSSDGSFASLDLKVGDWLISTGSAWKKIDNTDAVTGVKGSAESNYRIGQVSISAANVGAVALSGDDVKEGNLTIKGADLSINPNGTNKGYLYVNKIQAFTDEVDLLCYSPSEDVIDLGWDVTDLNVWGDNINIEANSQGDITITSENNLVLSSDTSTSGTMTLNGVEVPINSSGDTFATEEWVMEQGYVTSSGVTNVSYDSSTHIISQTGGTGNDTVVDLDNFASVTTTTGLEAVSIGGSSLNVVTRDTAQTITANKTFTNSILSIGSGGTFNVDSGASFMVGSNELHLGIITFANGGKINSNTEYTSGYYKFPMDDGSTSSSRHTLATQEWANSQGWVKSSGVTSITAGTGLTGGTITSTGTIALATSGVNAGTYSAVTVDTYGRVTQGGQVLNVITHGGTPGVVTGGWYFEEN